MPQRVRLLGLRRFMLSMSIIRMPLASMTLLLIVCCLPNDARSSQEFNNRHHLCEKMSVLLAAQVALVVLLVMVMLLRLSGTERKATGMSNNNNNNNCGSMQLISSNCGYDIAARMLVASGVWPVITHLQELDAPRTTTVPPVITREFCFNSLTMNLCSWQAFAAAAVTKIEDVLKAQH